jgi:hypothetical protein
METNHLINLTEADLDRRIHKIIELKYLLQWFDSQKNVLMHVGSWEDPFENFILKAPFKTEGEKLIVAPMAECMFGQSWTLTAQSDALWKVYSPNKLSVRVSCSIRSLLNCTLNGLPGSIKRVFLGKVKYLSTKKLYVISQEIFAKEESKNNRTWASSILYKRAAFAHEAEVRIVYVAPSCEISANKMVSYYSNPAVSIDEVLFDPRLSKDEVSVLKTGFVKQTSFKGKVAQSTLFSSPTIKFIPYSEAKIAKA